MEDKNKEFKFNTIVSEKDYRTIVYFDIFLKNRIYVVSMILAGILLIAAFILHIFNMIELNKFYFYYLFIFGLLILGGVLLAERMIKVFIKSYRVSIGASQNVQINDKNIQLRIGENEEVSIFEWNKLYKVYEIRKYFIFYINAQQTIIVSKKNITNEDIDILRNLIKEKMGKLFIKKLF